MDNNQLDLAMVWAKFDSIQITLLSLSIVFLLAQGLHAWRSGTITRKSKKFLFMEIVLPPEIEFKEKIQKYIYWFLASMFILSFIFFGFYSAGK